MELQRVGHHLTTKQQQDLSRCITNSWSQTTNGSFNKGNQMSWFAWEWGIPRHEASNAKISKLSAKWGSPSNSKKVFHHFFLLSLMAILLSPSISRLTTILSFSLNSSNSSESLASSYTKKIQSSGWWLFGLSIFRHIIYLHLYPWHWRRQWQPTPVLLPGKSHRWRSLVDCSPWGH